MDNREFDLISTDIREYTLRFQEAMLSFLRDCIIKRMYGSEDELIEALDSYNEKNPSFGILNEADSTADFNPSPYGRMDLAAAMKILRFMENESTTHISKRFLDTFSINEVDSYAKRLKTGNESRNIFAHYNKNKKVSFTKENMQQSMLFFINMFEDIEAINENCDRFSETEKASFVAEKETHINNLKSIYDEARMRTNIIPYTMGDIVAITGAEEKEVRMAVEYFDLVREGENLFSDSNENVQAMIEHLRRDKGELNYQELLPVSREKRSFTDEEMLTIAGKTMVIIDYSALTHTGVLEYLYRYGHMDYQIANSCIFVDATSLEKLRHTAYDSNIRLKEKSKANAKDAFKKMLQLKEYLRVQYVHDELCVEKDVEAVIASIPEHIAISYITADPGKIEKLWNMKRENLLVLSADTNGRLQVNLGQPHQIVAADVIAAVKDIELDEEQKQQYISGLKRNDETSKEDKSFSHEAKKQDNNGGMVISIKGGIPNQGLYTPHLNMQFSFYEPRSKRGAEGTVYQTNYGDYVVKIYHQKANTVERREKLNKMLEYSINKEFICWPEDILLTSADGEFIGFVMKQVKNPISLYEKIEELDLLSKDVKSRDNVSRLFLMDYCKRIAEQFFELHRHDILVGDVNESNILISRNDDEIYFVDTDSYQFDSYYSNVGQEMYTSPEYIERNSIEGELRYDSPKEYNDELFAMAVMFYRILFLGASPYKMQNGHVAAAILDREFDFFVSDTEVDESSFETLRESLVWNQTPTCIRELFVKTFRKSSRFKAEEWIDAIHMAENEIASGLYSNELIPGIKEYDKKPKNIEGNEAVEENNKQENELPQETKQVNEPVQPVQPVQSAKKPVPTTAKKKFVVTIPKIGQGSGNTQTTVSGQTNSGGIISIPKSPVLSNASNTSNTASRPAEKILAPENLSQKKNIQVTIPKIPNLPGRPGPKK